MALRVITGLLLWTLTHCAFSTRVLATGYADMAEQQRDLADLAALSGTVSTAIASAITEALGQHQRRPRGEAESAVANRHAQSGAGSSSR